MKQNGYLPCLMADVSDCAKVATPLNTSALTPVILNIKLQNLCNLCSYQTFKYLSLYNQLKIKGKPHGRCWWLCINIHLPGCFKSYTCNASYSILKI